MNPQQTLPQQLHATALAKQACTIQAYMDLALRAVPLVLERLNACAEEGNFELHISPITIPDLTGVTLPYLSDYINVLRGIACILEQEPYHLKTVLEQVSYVKDCPIDATLIVSW